MRASILVVPLTLAATPAMAQVFVGVGAGYIAVRDDAASPLAYGGLGGGLELGFGGRLRVTTGVALGHLWSSITTGDRPYETDVRAELRADYLHAAAGALRLGARFRTAADVRIHRFSGSYASDEVFVLGTALVGPGAQWGRPIGRGRITVAGALPLVGLLLRPYSDARLIVFGGQRPAFAVFPRLMGLDARVEWAPRDALARLGYRVTVERYTGGERYRAVAQTLYLALVP